MAAAFGLWLGIIALQLHSLATDGTAPGRPATLPLQRSERSGARTWGKAFFGGADKNAGVNAVLRLNCRAAGERKGARALGCKLPVQAK